MEELAGIVLLLLAVGFTVNLINGGRDGARAWVRAKLLGHGAVTQ